MGNVLQICNRMVKKSTRLALTICFSLCFVLLPTNGYADQKKVIKVVTGEWPPYVSKKTPDNGPLARVIGAIFGEHGIEVEYTYLPWTEGYDALVKGEYDATMPYYCSEERSKATYCSKPIFSGEMVFFYRKSNPFDWRQMSDLKGLRIGLSHGYFYGDELQDMEKRREIIAIRSSSDDTSMMALMRGRLDIYPQDKAVGYRLIRELFPRVEGEKITHHKLPLHAKPLHLLFSRQKKDSKKCLDMFDEGVEKLRKTGQLAKMLKSLEQAYP